ncbi:hypothetical protein [Agromyces ramosus]|uniref:Uncharacterized protein n=1 Tax=Agromyces ramosus TaxID=33879 RepID=A0ABU0R9R5_9MICO|nr:hypothetical protein [Agromyces ramosus]MDQ0894814.1 hypothetical protein [Agromyces ramosus]
MSDQQRYVTGTELDEFADFVKGNEDGHEAAELMDRWFEPFERAASA